MFFAMYDRFLKSMGETYILESWSRIQRAVDFDELKIVGEQIPQSANPFFVVANDDKGKMMFSGLASTPMIDEKGKKTTMYLKDYTTLFNTEIIVDWSKFKGETVGEYVDFLLSIWIYQIDVGFSGISWDVSDLSDILLDPDIPLGENVENVSLSELVFDVLNYYEVHCLPELDIFKKKLIFFFKKSSLNTVSVRLRDFGVTDIEKSFGEYNRATIYDYNHNKIQQWSLTPENNIIKIFPVGIKNVIELGGELSGGGSLEKVLIEMYLIKGSELKDGDKMVHDDEEADIWYYKEGTYGLRCLTNGWFHKNKNSIISGIYMDNVLYVGREDSHLIYPAKNRNFVASENNDNSLYDAIYDAVMGLAGNRYQENIDLNAQQYKSILDLTSIDFSYKISVYTDDGYYKDLPVGEIETDSKGRHIVRLGQRIQELTQEL